MNSSYSTTALSYDTIFNVLIWAHNPKRIVEFGILEGYSLMCFAKQSDPSTEIKAFDIFEKFNGNSAKRDVVARFDAFPNVTIQEGNFYDTYKQLEDNSIDILHIDIANDGDVYEFAIENYMQKLTSSGVLILEGGSQERDEISWMIKYNKKKIRETLSKLAPNYRIHTISTFPSLTLIKHK